MKANSRKLIAVLMAIMMLTMAFSGCGSTTATGSSSSAAGSSAAEATDTVSFTDDAGRTVDIPSPSSLSKVYYTSPVGFIAVYTMDTDKCAGIPYDLTEGEISYMNASVSKLQNLGGVQVGAELNKEAILNSGAQIIFNMSTGKISDTTISDSDSLQDQLGIPVVILDMSLDKIATAYRSLGKIFGEEDRAEKLATYCEGVLSDVDAKVATISDADKVSVYYAEKGGLTTDPESSQHSEVLTRAGAKNVADVEMTGQGGMSSCSLEQVLAWNPDVIISWADEKGGAYSTITTSADWSNIAAVKNGKVYQMPYQPFSWIDRPPSVNRILGLEWMTNLLYPDVYKIDIREKTKEFYKLFYQADLTDSQVSELLTNATAK